MVVGAVNHPHFGPEGERGVAGRHAVHVKDLSAGGFTTVENASVPGSDAMEFVTPSEGGG
jgi:hypothetical protein